MSCLILFKSITYAQNGLYRLSKEGITAYIVRKPSDLVGKSCGYGLKIKCDDIKRAKSILTSSGVLFTSFWQKHGTQWREI